MATIINNRSSLKTDPIRNFRFLVTFKPLDPGAAGGSVNNPKNPPAWRKSEFTLGFTSVSGLVVTTDSIPYREGGYNTTVHQIPGQTTFSPVTFQRGVILGSGSNWSWMRQLFATVMGQAGRKNANVGFRADVEIEVLSHPIPGAGYTNSTSDATDHVALRFNLYNAWITSLAYSDLNAGDNAILVEQMTLVHEGFDMTWATDLVNDAADF